MQNALIASLNGKPRDGCLNRHCFRPLHCAREEIGGGETKTMLAPAFGLGYHAPTELLRTIAAAALETLAVSALPLRT